MTSTSLEEIMDKAYDKFDIEIKNVQLLFGKSGIKALAKYIIAFFSVFKICMLLF